MKILCKIKEDATKKGNFGWQNVTLLAPLSIGNYLDKQLDERYISFYSKKAVYRCGAIVGIGYKKDDQALTEWEYFILGRDSSAQSSFKKGVYFHQDAFLLEATKYLEGILCQSITFTNTKVSTADIKFVVPYNTTVAKVDETTYRELTQKQINSISDIFHSPVEIGNLITIPSLNYVANIIINAMEVGKGKIKYDANGAHPAITIGKEKKEITSETEGEADFYTRAETGGLSVTYLLYIGTVISGGGGEFTAQYAFTFYIDTKLEIINVTSSEPWTIPTVVKRILDLAEPLFAIVRSSDDGTETIVEPLPKFYLSTDDETKYYKTLAPEFTMTDCNLREQLQTVGGFIHAEPRATYEPNENAFRISFDDYGDPGEADLSGASLIERHGSMDISQYATEVKSNAQNLVNANEQLSGTISDPASDFFRTVRSENVYARITEKNARIMTQNPIYTVEKIEGGIVDNSGEWIEVDTAKEKFPVDITDFLVERAEYDSNLSTYGENLTKSKAFCLYYTQGVAGIDGIFYQAPNAENNALSHYAISNIFALRLKSTIKVVDDLVLKNAARLAFRVTYTPIFAATVSHSKSKYDPTLPKWQQVYNQSGNMIETTYYGENLKMTAAMLGNPEEERTYLLSPQARLPGVGKRLDNFAISAVKAEIYPRYTKATLALTRDFERISEFVGIDSVKRVYEVSEKEVYNRNVFLKSYIVIGKKPSQIPTANIGVDMKYLGHSFYAPNSTDENTVFLPVSCVKVKGKSNHQTYPAVQIPVIASSFGNSMEFSFCMKDNYSAGDKSQYIETTKDDVTGYWLTDVPYGDAYGRIEYLDATFLQKSSDTASAYYTTPETTFAGTYTGDVLKFNKPYYIRKDSREKITVSVSVEFRATDEKLIIGSALAARSTLVSREEPRDCSVGILKSPINKSARYVASENIAESTKLSVALESDCFCLQTSPDVSPAPATGAGWVIYRTLPEKTVTVVTESGSQKTVTYGGENEVLLAYNRPIQKGESMFHDGSTPLFCFYQVNA